MAELYRYAAFISYSSKDAAFAKRLHRTLERYGIPSSLGKFDLIGDGKKNRIYPVFIDREELSAGHLGDQIEANLKASAALIVVCSPNSAASRWVQKEIEFFVAQGRHAKVFAIIPDTAPLVDEDGADCTPACFPPAFCGDALIGYNLEPLAADARKGKDGFRNAWLKIVAGMIGVSPGQIVDRDRKRRKTQRIALAMSLGAFGVVFALFGASIDGYNRSGEFASRANVLFSAGRPVDAGTFALGASAPFGSAIQVVHPDTQTALEASFPLPLAADLGPVRTYRFSNDGRYLAAQAPELDNPALQQVALYDLTGALITRAVIGKARRFEFSPDSRFIALLDDDEVLTLMDLTGTARNTRRFGDDDTHYLSFQFSGNGRYLLLQRTTRSGSQLLDLSSPTGEPVALEEFARFFFAHDGSVLATWFDRPAQTTIYDLRGATPRAHQIGAVRPSSFSPDGEFLVAEDAVGGRLLFDLKSPQPETAIALPSGGQYGFSPGSHFVFALNENDVGVLRDLRQPGLASRAFEASMIPSFSHDDAFVVTERTSLSYFGDNVARVDGRQSLLYDLRDWNAPPQQLTPDAEHALSPDGRYLTSRTSQAEGRLIRVSDGAQVLAFGKVWDMSFSDASTRLITIGLKNEAMLYDLRSIGAEPVSLGQVRKDGAGYYFLGDDRFLLTRSEDDQAVLHDLRAVPVRSIRLGILGPGFEPVGVSNDGTFLVIEDKGGSLALRRAEATPMSADQICKASHAAVRPFPDSVRANPQDHLYARLRGRPWNPCDWRGLGAIFPDTEHGDGWFEGARQWVQLVGVQFFGGKDWSCSDSTSQASPETRAARADMCRQSGDHAIPSSTSAK